MIKFTLRLTMKLSLFVLPLLAFAQNPPAAPEMPLNAAEKQFQDSMNNVTLAGHYTVGDSAELHEDKYAIERVSKVRDDMWKFEARIQYNKQDMKVAMTFPVKFAGDTPVISLTNYTVPGFGAFTARVVLYDGAYAGTWASAKPGSKHGGTMFGKIVKNPASAAK
jgi:hypothetical protein